MFLRLFSVWDEMSGWFDFWFGQWFGWMDIFLLFGEVEGIYTTGICIGGYIYAACMVNRWKNLLV